MLHTGHAEFLDVEGQLHSFRSQALNAISTKTFVETGRGEAGTGNLKSLNRGAFGATCQALTIPDDNKCVSAC
jgi:hypothetical protein